MQGVAAAGAGLVAGGCVLDRLGGRGQAEGELPRRVLGRTRVPVTILGLGCAHFGQRDEAQTQAIVEAALEEGVRYFDTAPNYGPSEARLGPLLAPVRDKVFLVTKVDYPDGERAEADLRNSLDRLKTDHVDLLLQHCVQDKGGKGSPSDTDTMLAPGGSFEVMCRARREGRTRFIGISLHYRHSRAQILLDHSDEWDVIMPFVNYVSRAGVDAETEFVEPARHRGLGVVAMKVLGGDGQLASDYDRAFRYTLSVPGVACAVIGVRSVEEVRRAARAAREFRPLTRREMAETIRLGEELHRAKAPKATQLWRHLPGDAGARMA
jgi:aryl-alcohol dehydrogenase-like predicted oxidoreductase